MIFFTCFSSHALERLLWCLLQNLRHLLGVVCWDLCAVYEVRFLFDRSTALRNYPRFMAFWKHVLQLPNSTMQILTHQNVHLRYKYTNFWTCKIYINRVNNLELRTEKLMLLLQTPLYPHLFLGQK